MLGYLPTQTYILMKTAYGNNVLSHATIFHWHTLFAVGKASAVALPRSGSPKMSSIEIMVKNVVGESKNMKHVNMT